MRRRWRHWDLLVLLVPLGVGALLVRNLACVDEGSRVMQQVTR
jgi:hypothetical protein